MRSTGCFCSRQVLRPTPDSHSSIGPRLLERFYFARLLLRVDSGNTHNMTTHIQTQNAIRTLTNAFAPMDCLIMAARKGCFSFTIVNEHGIARHSERLYPNQYSSDAPLQAVIDRTRQALVA
jgi:hypothetical protein